MNVHKWVNVRSLECAFGNQLSSHLSINMHTFTVDFLHQNVMFIYYVFYFFKLILKIFSF